jgi:hypothetical protein
MINDAKKDVEKEMEDEMTRKYWERVEKFRHEIEGNKILNEWLEKIES